MTFGPVDTYNGDEIPLYTQEQLLEHKRQLLRQRSRANEKIRRYIDIELDYINRLIGQ